MTQTIIPWKNTGEEEMKKKRLFKIRWDAEKGIWVPDKNGKHLGYLLHQDGKTRLAKYVEPEQNTPDLTTKKLVFEKPSLGIVEPSEEESE